MRRRTWLAMALVLCGISSVGAGDLPNPVLFVTQVPTDAYLNMTSAFGAHTTSMQHATRGGDLWIRYPDGSLRNLTAEAGYGLASAQDGPNAIVVRQPTVHWSGQKAIFSMIRGAPTQRYQVITSNWQLYEVTGLGQGQTASITKVPCQPTTYNNLAPLYASDDQIIFVSDRPRDGSAQLYPQRDEYESEPSDTGLWKLDPVACTFRHLEHAPSGVTYPSIDSAGRVVFTKWDHLQRDQQADTDTFEGGGYGTFNYASEAATSPPATFARAEQFPELREAAYSKLPGQGYDGSTPAADYPFNGFLFNEFMPWTVNQDGSAEETVNHVGRHEIGGSYSDGSFRTDPALDYLQPGRYNGASYFLRGDGGLFHLKEDPAHAGRFYAVNSPEFSTATAGDIVYFDAPTSANPDGIGLHLVGDDTALGRMRNPLPLSDGRLLVVDTPGTANLSHTGTSTAPIYNYAFRIRFTTVTNGTITLGPTLTQGLSKSISYWDPDQRVSWSGPLWELDPVEVRVRPVPASTGEPGLPAPEAQILSTAGVDPTLLSHWLHARKLALVVSRNVTSRDRSDVQQPYNLSVTGSTTQTIGAAGQKVYPVSHMQFFQADQLRGYANGAPPQQGGTVEPGRRVLAMPLHDPAAVQAMAAHLVADPVGATPISPDGSMAAFVPAGRAMAWQLVDSSKTGWARAVVRERNWVSFVPGELRVCANCHGVNTLDQAGHSTPQNPPQALTALLGQWRKVVRNNCAETGGTGSWSYSGVSFSTPEDGVSYRIQTCQGGNGCCDGLPTTETLSSAPGSTPTPAATATPKPTSTPAATATPVPTSTPTRPPTPASLTPTPKPPTQPPPTQVATVTPKPTPRPPRLPIRTTASAQVSPTPQPPLASRLQALLGLLGN